MSSVFPAEPRVLLSQAARILQASGELDAANFLKGCNPTVEELGYDEWNGGTRYWRLQLNVEPEQYGRVKRDLEPLKAAVSSAVGDLFKRFPNDLVEVDIFPDLPEVVASTSKPEISREARADVFGYIRSRGVNWSGVLSHPDFLNRIYELERMPSKDVRYQNSWGDIYKHTVEED